MSKILIQFIMMISVGALIGWFTNYLAIKLLFRPYKEINFLFFKIQGLIPKRKNEIIENIAEVVEQELISMTDIVNKFKNSEIDGEILDNLLDKIVDYDRVVEVKKYVKKSILDNKEEIVEEIVKIVEEKINFKEIMLEKMENFSLKEIEDIILRVSKEELKHIEIIGGILGAVIAIFQFLLMLVINKI